MSGDRIQFRRGGGCLMLFGLPFLAAGLFVVFSPFLGVPWKDGSGNPASPVPLVVFGSIFATVGASIMFGRAVVTIDRREEEVVSWWGVLVPFKTTRRGTKEFSVVALSREVRRSDKSSHTVFPVRLVCEEGDDVTLVEPRENHREGRRQAERVAKFLGLGLRDETSETPTLREAGTLDHSVRDLLREEPPADPGPPPAGLDVRREGRSAVIEVPAPGIGPQHLVFAAVCVGFVLLPLGFFSSMFWDLFAGEEPFHPGHVVFGVFAAGFVGGPLLMAAGLLLSALTFETIKVSPEGVHVTRTGRFRVSEDELSFDVIEEIELSRAGAGTARALPLGSMGTVSMHSDERTLECGRGLEPEGRAWLRELLRCQAAGNLPAALD